jgi:surface protein
MNRYKKQQQNFYFILSFLLILGLGIGYALLSEKLTLSNSISLSEMKWDVGFSNVEDNGSTISTTAEITNNGKSITVICDIGTNTDQQICTVKATIINNSTFDISLSEEPTISYDDTYIHTITFKWNNHPTYGNYTVLKDNYIEKGKSEEVIITIKTKFITKDMFPILNTTIQIKITLNFVEWKKSNLPNKNDLAILKATTSSDSSAFRSSTYKEKIKTITFENNINIPDNAIKTWDIGIAQNGNVMAYVLLNESDSTYYDLFIQSNSQLYANEDMSNWFKDLIETCEINGLNLLNTSSTTNMQYMFAKTGYKCSTLDLNLDSNFDTSNVTNMYQMFYYTGYQSTKLTLDVSNFDTSNVTNMCSMFFGTGSNVTNLYLDTSNFNTSKVTTMKSMFYQTGRNSTKVLVDVSNFDTSNVTNMSGMFNMTGFQDTSFKLDVSNFDTHNVTNMSNMFSATGYSNPNFELDTSNFDTSSLIDTSGMFYSVGSKSNKLVTSITIRNSNINSYENTFLGAATLSGAQIIVNYTSETEDLIEKLIATKSSESNIVKGKKVPILYYIGKEVNFGGENFYVIEDNGSTVKILSKYNLGTDYMQSENADGVAFSSDYGWANQPGPKEINIKEYNGAAKNFVANYTNYFKSLTANENISGNLLSLKELKKLGCTINDDYSAGSELTCTNSIHKSWLLKGNGFWTHSAFPTDTTKVWVVLEDGNLDSLKANENYHGIRPTLKLTKQILEENLNKFKFYIEETTYYAKVGMTWEDWVNSDYNTNNFRIENSTIKTGSGNITYSIGDPISMNEESKTNIIKANYTYRLGGGWN